ncbi:MAG: response regulator transcription factor [Bacillota bacterium]|nr:response regulator transcription factor [Bacillota bacterium]
MTPIRVLVADDNAGMREAIRVALQGEAGIEIVGEAGDGLEAVEAVDRLEPDVVLMDIGMPGLNGIEATRAIRSRRASCRVLVLSIHDEPEYARLALEAGALGYLLKGSAARELAPAIRAVFRRQAVLDPAVARALAAGEARRPRGAAAGAAGAPSRPERVEAEAQPSAVPER